MHATYFVLKSILVLSTKSKDKKILFFDTIGVHTLLFPGNGIGDKTCK